MEKATTNSLRREAEELGLRAGRKVDVIDSIDGEENLRRSGAVISAFLSMRHGWIQGMFPIQLLTADRNGREGAFAWILKNWF